MNDRIREIMMRPSAALLAGPAACDDATLAAAVRPRRRRQYDPATTRIMVDGRELDSLRDAFSQAFDLPRAVLFGDPGPLRPLGEFRCDGTWRDAELEGIAREPGETEPWHIGGSCDVDAAESRPYEPGEVVEYQRAEGAPWLPGIVRHVERPGFVAVEDLNAETRWFVRAGVRRPQPYERGERVEVRIDTHWYDAEVIEVAFTGSVHVKCGGALLIFRPSDVRRSAS